MKNLLLLFTLGFALFWVGCEKEEMTVEAIESLSQIQSLSSSSVINCCETGSFKLQRYYSPFFSGGGYVKVDFNDQQAGEPIDGFENVPYVNFKILVNDDFVYYDEDVDVGCEPLQFTVTENVVVGQIEGCPYTVRAIATVYDYDVDDAGEPIDELVVCSSSFSGFQLRRESRNCPGNTVEPVRN